MLGGGVASIAETDLLADGSVVYDLEVRVLRGARLRAIRDADREGGLGELSANSQRRV